MKILFTFIFVVLYFNFILASLTDHKVNLEEKNSAHPDNFYQPPKCSHFPKYNYEHSTPHPLVVMSPDFVSYDQKSQRNPPFVEPPYYPTSQQAPYRSLASNTRLYQPGAYKEIPQIPIPYDQKSQMPSSYDQMLHPSTLYHKLPQAPSTYEKRLRLPMFYDQRSQMTSSYDRMPHHFTSYKQITSFPPSYNQPPHLSISIQRLPSIPSSSDNYQPHSSSSREPKPYAPSYSNQNLFSSQNDRIYFLNQNFPSLFRLPSSRHLVNYYKKNHQQLPYLGSSYYGYPTYSPATQKRYPPWFIQNIPVSRPMEKTKEPIFLGKGVYNILTEGSAELICSFENSSHQVVSNPVWVKVTGPYDFKQSNPSFKCETSGCFYSDIIKNSRFRVTNNGYLTVLRIYDIQPIDCGLYRCSVTGIDSKGETNTLYKVIEFSYP